MIYNTTSRLLLTGLDGAQAAHHVLNRAGWARQKLENLAARSASFPVAPQQMADGVDTTPPSRHDRAVAHVAWARNFKICKLTSGLIDGVVGSGVPAPAARPTASIDERSKHAIFEDDVAALGANIDHMLANPRSVGVLGLAVGLAQFVPTTVGGMLGAVAGGTVGCVVHAAHKGVNALFGRGRSSNDTEIGASLGALFGAGLSYVAVATVLPISVGLPVLAASSLIVSAPFLGLQAIRAANVGLRAGVLGGAYLSAAICCAGADTIRSVANGLSNLHLPTFGRRSAEQTVAPSSDETAPSATPADDTDDLAAVPTEENDTKADPKTGLLDKDVAPATTQIKEDTSAAKEGAKLSSSTEQTDAAA